MPDKDKPKDEPERFPRRDTPGDLEKRSRFCKHGYIWGRCPQGC